MARIILFYILPFLLPFIGFFTYRLLVTRGRPLLENTPWFVLSTAGLGLVIVSLVTLALAGGWDHSGDYVPPRFEDGRIVPGEVRNPDGHMPAEAIEPFSDAPSPGDDG
jgi:hypothetical protein